ncbi:MAG: PilZ domain-containing protein [Myxococcota bacterium]
MSSVGSVQPRSARRRTSLSVTVTHNARQQTGHLEDISASGAFITGVVLPVGDVFECSVSLPRREVECRMQSVWCSDHGIGAKYIDISASSLAALKDFAFYKDLEGAIVDIQRNSELTTGVNLLPVSSGDEVRSLLDRLNGADVELFDSRARRQSSSARLDVVERGLTVTGQTGHGYVLGRASAILIAFELVPSAQPGFENGVFPVPSRVYVMERRSSGRQRAPVGASLTLGVPGGPYTVSLPVVDWNSTGASVTLPAERTFLMPGQTFPGATLSVDEEVHSFQTARVRHISRDTAGLQLHVGPVASTQFTQTSRVTDSKGRGVLRKLRHLWGLWFAKKKSAEEEMRVVRFSARSGEDIVGICDFSESREAGAAVEVCYVLAPAFLRRKEGMLPFARTLVDNLATQGMPGAVIRFDHTHMGHESFTPSEDLEQGRPYYDWNYQRAAEEIKAALVFAKQTLKAKKVVLVSISNSALTSRLAMRDAALQELVDLWVLPFGCPDLQDMLRNVLAGEDYFSPLERGEVLPDADMYGRPYNYQSCLTKALDDKLVYPPDAQRDFSELKVPAFWILGRYDFLVTNSRVEAATEGTAVRRIVVDTGHVAQRAEEALNVFKLVFEESIRELFAREVRGRDPDTARIQSQAKLEKQRAKLGVNVDLNEFWRNHLFGDNTTRGYDIVENNPSYVAFAEQQIQLLDAKAGQSVYDAGCGTGFVTSSLAKAQPGLNFHVSDLVEDGVEHTLKKLDGGWGRALDLKNCGFEHLRRYSEGDLVGPEALCRASGWVDGDHPPVFKEGVANRMHLLLRRGAASLSQVEELLGAEHRQLAERLLNASQVISSLVRGETPPAEALGKLGYDIDAIREIESRGPYDRVMSTLVVSYLRDPLACLSWFYRILKPGGRLLVSSVLPDWDPSRLYMEHMQMIEAEMTDPDEAERERENMRQFGGTAGQLCELEEQSVFRFFSPEELDSMLREIGFAGPRTYLGLSDPAMAIIAVAEK